MAGIAADDPRVFVHESGYTSIDMSNAFDNTELVYGPNEYYPEKPWRWQIKLDMAGYVNVDRNITEDIDLFDLLDWLKENKPDLLAERGLIIQEKTDADV